MAITHSPSRSLSESPNFTALSVLSECTRSRARSLLESLPTSWAGSLVPSLRITLISSASAMTWLLVTTSPEASMMKPEPSELTRRGARSASPCPRRFLKNSSKNSSIGEPGGRSGILPMRASTFCEVEMLTTASITCSATSAMFSGPRAAAIEAGRTTIAAVRPAARTLCRTSRERWQTLNKQDMTSMLLKDQRGERVPPSHAGRKAIERAQALLGTGLGRKSDSSFMHRCVGLIT